MITDHFSLYRLSLLPVLNITVIIIIITLLILIFPSLPFSLSIDYFMYLKHVIFRWLLRKRYIHNLVRVSWHNYVCILNRSCIVVIQLYLSLIMSNKLFWSWSYYVLTRPCAIRMLDLCQHVFPLLLTVKLQTLQTSWPHSSLYRYIFVLKYNNN